MVKGVSRPASAAGSIRVGFVPLIDAAPLVVAHELGYFVEEGLNVALLRQIGWGNVRDKLTFGQLHASHALLGMVPLSVLGREEFIEPLVEITALGTGGNAITLSRWLESMAITSAPALARLVRSRSGKPLVFAHVFSCSTHHYLLRTWLASAGINPDKDVRLCVLPPAQMTRQMAQGMLDGFCVGDPWSSLAERDGLGTIAVTTASLAPDHPEKSLVVSRRWLDAHPDASARLVRGVLRGCAFCHDRSNANPIARLLSKPQYLDVPEEVVARSLGEVAPGFRSWSPAATFPDPARVAWLLGEMLRWGHVPDTIDCRAVSRAAVEDGPYREAAASLGWPGPAQGITSATINHGSLEPMRRSPVAATTTV